MVWGIEWVCFEFVICVLSFVNSYVIEYRGFILIVDLVVVFLSLVKGYDCFWIFRLFLLV